MQRWFGCLHGDAVVTTSDGPKRLRSLQAGDSVLSRRSDGTFAFSPVLAFLHRDPARPLSFLRLQLAANRSVAVTPNHLVFRRRADAGLEAVFAALLRPGDRLLLLLPSGQLSAAVLLRSERFEARGAFAPMTESGTMLANGVLVSSYAQVRSHSLAHAVMLPVRLLTATIGPLTSTKGLSRYAEFLLWLGRRLLPRGWLFAT